MELQIVLRIRMSQRLWLQHNIQKCSFSTCASLWLRQPIKSNRRVVFSSPLAAKAQKPIYPRDTKEVFLAQRRRPQWDFPLGDDQRASWKHKQWYDPYFDKWVPNFIPPKMKTFSLYKKNKRGIIEDQETLENKFKLLLDHDRKAKYIIPPLNMEFTRNASYYYQHLTHTKFVHGMPYNIESMQLEDSVIENFESFLTTAIQLETHFSKKSSVEKSRKQRADRLLSNIVQYLMDITSSQRIFEGCELDRNPENSMFWQKGRGFHKYTMRDDLPITFQSHDNPLYQIRTQKPLNEFTPWMEEFMLSGEIPFPDDDIIPSCYRLFKKQYRNTVTPGFRYQAGELPLNYQEALEENKLLDLPPPITDPCKFGHTQFLSLPESFNRDWYKANLEHCDITEEIEEHMKAHGIMSGWTWSAPVAYYMGHWMDNDITKPICVQTVITDGEYISFFCYQLNTVAIDPENLDEKIHEKRNICYGTPMMRLYNKVEGTDDVQLYRDVTTLLLKFIHNGCDNKAANIDDVIEHNKSLEVQEFDLENPLIELQKPKHVREKEEREAVLQIAKQEEIARNKNLKDKVIDWVKG